MSTLRLDAATPAQWISTHLDRFQRRYDREASAGRWYDAAEATADEGPMRRQHAQYVAEGATPQAAAKWVVGEHAGCFAAAVGYLWAYAGATVLDVDRVRFGTHPDGWVQLVDLGAPRVAVLAAHPWSGQPGVRTVSAEELAGLVVESVRTLGAPLVAAGRTLARVGATTLWAEVADSLGLAPASNREHPADPAVLADLDRVLRRPGAPWRKRPEAWLVEHGDATLALGRKGGCCLAYQSEPEPSVDPPAEVDPWTVAWEAAFPPVEGEPAYCSTCSFRDREDCAARQLWEHDYELRLREA